MSCQQSTVYQPGVWKKVIHPRWHQYVGKSPGVDAAVQAEESFYRLSWCCLGRWCDPASRQTLTNSSPGLCCQRRRLHQRGRGVKAALPTSPLQLEKKAPLNNRGISIIQFLQVVVDEEQSGKSDSDFKIKVLMSKTCFSCVALRCHCPCTSCLYWVQALRAAGLPAHVFLKSL